MFGKTVPEIRVADLARLRQEGDVAVLDIRELWEREIARLEGSLNIPLSELPASVGALPRDRPLVVLCHHGVRSAQAARWLRAQGFDNAVNLRGGIDEWARHIDPAMASY